jgi:light-regulated signal transduction histidine kinase (bacteriophytochrome)
MITLAEKISKGSFITVTDTRKDEFASLVSSLNEMSETLERNFMELKNKNEELDQFAYVVSHDLKAPLRGISNIISWIEEDHEVDLTPNIKNNFMLIKGRARRLENMINGLLEYARVGKLKKGVEKIELNAFLKEIKELIVPGNVTFITDKNLPTIYAEKLLLEQVFSNLISNAFKHNNVNDPKIVIGCSDKGTHYEFSVTDNGPGIEKEYFDKIFVIFQTLQERDAFESTGVGLAIVKKIVENQKGTIHIESQLGKGTTIMFTWPKLKSP